MTDKKGTLSPLIVILLTFVLILGILSGVILSGRMDFDINESVFTSDKKTVFINAILSQSLILGVVALGSAHLFISPLIFLSVFSKGLFYGFTAGSVVKTSALSGLFKIIPGIGVYNFLFFALIIPYAAYAFTKSAECFLNRQNYDFKRRANKKFILYTLAAFALSLLLGLIQCIAANSLA